MNPCNKTYSPSYGRYSIQANERFACHEEILARLLRLFDYMTANHNKVFFMRFDVRFPAGIEFPGDNARFERFIASLSRNLKRKGLDPHYLWCYERSREKHQHYHVVLLLNGSLTQSIKDHIELAASLWSRALQLPEVNRGLICDCTKSRTGESQQNGIMIRRNSPDFSESFCKAFEWASYLAKCNTKGYAPDGVREFGSSTTGSFLNELDFVN